MQKRHPRSVTFNPLMFQIAKELIEFVDVNDLLTKGISKERHGGESTWHAVILIGMHIKMEISFQQGRMCLLSTKTERSVTQRLYRRDGKLETLQLLLDLNSNQPQPSWPMEMDDGLCSPTTPERRQVGKVWLRIEERHVPPFKNTGDQRAAIYKVI